MTSAAREFPACGLLARAFSSPLDAATLVIAGLDMAIHRIDSTLRDARLKPANENALAARARLLGELPVIRQHRLQQHLRALGALLGRGKFRLVMADAVPARHEDHGGRRHAGNIWRVVGGAPPAGAGRKAAHGAGAAPPE